MKTADIVPGNYYSDGKSGLRQVRSIDARQNTVHYVILSAKYENDFTVAVGKPTSIVGHESSCQLESFAAWSKIRILESEGENVVHEFRAKKVKLSPGERTYMVSVKTEAPDARKGTAISYDHTEGRAVGGLHRKGLVEAPANGEVVITDLGAGYLRII